MTPTPFALKDTLALIEKVFPAQKISAEAHICTPYELIEYNRGI